MSDPFIAPTAPIVFYRSYSRQEENGTREDFEAVFCRCMAGLSKLGNFTQEEFDLVWEYFESLKVFPSGRWLFVGGTEWLENPLNYHGVFNCTSREVISWEIFGELMDLSMQGSGTGAVLESRCISQLPPICNHLKVEVTPLELVGSLPKEYRIKETIVSILDDSVNVICGDSRQGWVRAYQALLELSSNPALPKELSVNVDLTNVRAVGERLKGFGGVANPVKLPQLFTKVVNILNEAIGRQLTDFECCLLLDEAALTVVAGNIRRCLPGNTSVMTEYGLSTLSYLEKIPGIRVKTSKGYKKVVQFFDQGEQSLCRVNCVENGRFLECTSNHKIAVLTEATENYLLADLIKDKDYKMVPAKDLKKGDQLIWSEFAKPDFVVFEVDEVDFDIRTAHTYDIEVEEDHEFFADNFLVSNSAGIKQFSSQSPLYKKDLWIKEDGKWKIDPKREALRMSNHTRIFHAKPTLKECIEAVREQRYSGEGAIQWAGEAVARANADLLKTSAQKTEFLATYEQSPSEAGVYLQELQPGMSMEELDHRLHRYGLNPCLAGETIVRYREKYSETDQFAPIEELAKMGAVRVYDAGGNLVETQFKKTQERALVVEITLTCQEVNRSVTCTLNHKWFMSDDPRKKGYVRTEASEIKIGDYLLPATQSSNQEPWQVIDIQVLQDEQPVYCCTVETTHSFDLEHLHTGNCGEIIGKNLGCNLAEIHLNQLDPFNFEEQENAFKAGALVCAALLQRNFVTEPAKTSRELDPIVGVSFTGLFDFFVKAFGVDWLRWWEAGRPDEWGTIEDSEEDIELFEQVQFFCKNEEFDHWIFDDKSNFYKTIEKRYLSWWKEIVRETVWEYCDRHNLKRPNRCTTVQPSGSKSLLTGASPGWHPPIASTFIRRITIDKNHPIALAAIDLGCTVVPAQDDKDEQGNLLNDPFDPRVKTWLIELPVRTSWADLPGAEKIDISKFSAEAQFDFYMQVQKFYARHNVSATISLREHEIEGLGTRIYEAIRDNEGYISAALLARFDDRQSFPRLPFEPISKEQYEQMMIQVENRRTETDFYAALSKHDQATQFVETQQGPAGCDSDKCLLPDVK